MNNYSFMVFPCYNAIGKVNEDFSASSAERNIPKVTKAY